MKNNTIIINNKEYILPDSVLLIFNEYLDNYFRDQRLKQLSNSKNQLMNQFKETSNIHFKRKAKLKKQISDLTTEMMKVGISKVKIEIPDWQTIDNSSLKYQFLLKLTNMVCNIIGEFVQESNEQIIKLYRSFVQEINTNIHLSKNFIKKDNYNTAFKKLYRTLEINLTTYKLIKEIEKNPNIDVEQYFKNLKVNSDKDDNQSNIEVEKGKNL